MKQLTLFFMAFVLPQVLNAQHHPPTTISSIIVYEEGAMVTRQIDTKNIVKNGTVVIDSLPYGVDPKTFQVNCGEGLKIVSIKNTLRVEKEYDLEQKDSLLSLIPPLEDSIEYQNTLLKSIQKEIDVIRKNDDFDTDQGTNMDELIKASELYKTRLRSLDLEHHKITKIKKGFVAQKQKLHKSANAIRPQTYKNIGVEIKLDFVSHEDKTLEFSYFTSEASWYSFYDLRIDETNGKSILDHKAYVSQSTGEDWNEVDLTLSNRNPNKRTSPPAIKPYILQNVKHHGYSQETNKKYDPIYENGKIHGIITDSSGEPLIGANILYKGSAYGTITDMDGRFSLPKLNFTTLVISYTGFQTQEVDITSMSFCSVVLAEGALLDEVVVTGMGIDNEANYQGYAISKIQNTLAGSSSKKEKARKAISIKAQRSLNVHSFDIKIPYTIPSDGEEYDVLLISNDIPFIYQHITYPSEEATAYLKVGIPEWRTYDLFSGDVNLFLESQYTGVSHLDIEEQSDTLWFSLGEDIGVQVEKDVVKEFNKKSFFKNKTIELHTFDITVKNNKLKQTNIKIMDQVPISTDDDIKVKILEVSNATHDEEKGFLTWEELLQPGESKTYRVSYEIKYGKHVDIVSK